MYVVSCIVCDKSFAVDCITVLLSAVSQCGVGASALSLCSQLSNVAWGCAVASPEVLGSENAIYYLYIQYYRTEPI